ncbi:MAG: substrate-binding domain-containing protein [Anaerolineae bacterium]
MPAARNRRATMMDVANLAGVSYQTVSRVVNHHPNVAPATRERVLRVIEDMRYRPSQAARALAARRTGTLAVVTYNMMHFGPTQMIANLDVQARDAGYDLMVVHVNPTNPAALNGVVDQLLRWEPEGVLLVAPIQSALYQDLVRHLEEIPMVQLDIQPGSSARSVIVDQREGSRRMTSLMLEFGHRLIVEIAGPPDWYGAAARHIGMADVLDAHGLEPVFLQYGDWSAESGYRAAVRALERGRFTAIVAANDQMALGAIRALQVAGLRVPEDVSVGGFDDVPEAAYFTPPLTTIRQDFTELARQGLAYLIRAIADPVAEHGQRVIMPRLIQRESAGPRLR